MNADGHDVGDQLHPNLMESTQNGLRPPIERPTIHYTELPESASDSPIATEWNFYRREVGRLLAQGLEGKWVLIKGEEIIGIWNMEEEADQFRLKHFLKQPVLLKQLCAQEPVLRGGAYLRPWRS